MDEHLSYIDCVGERGWDPPPEAYSDRSVDYDYTGDSLPGFFDDFGPGDFSPGETKTEAGQDPDCTSPPSRRSVSNAFNDEGVVGPVSAMGARDGRPGGVIWNANRRRREAGVAERSRNGQEAGPRRVAPPRMLRDPDRRLLGRLEGEAELWGREPGRLSFNRRVGERINKNNGVINMQFEGGGETFSRVFGWHDSRPHFHIYGNPAGDGHLKIDFTTGGEGIGGSGYTIEAVFRGRREAGKRWIYTLRDNLSQGIRFPLRQRQQGRRRTVDTLHNLFDFLYAVWRQLGARGGRGERGGEPTGVVDEAIERIGRIMTAHQNRLQQILDRYLDMVNRPRVGDGCGVNITRKRKKSKRKKTLKKGRKRKKASRRRNRKASRRRNRKATKRRR